MFFLFFFLVIILWHMCVQGIVQIDYCKQIFYIFIPLLCQRQTTQVTEGWTSQRNMADFENTFRNSNLIKGPKVNSAYVLVISQIKRT